MHFYVGLHHPSDAGRFDRSFISINAIRARKSRFPANRWILDSGAFTEISTHGRFREEPEVYAGQVVKWATNGCLEMAVTQDWMCEPFIVAKTGLSVREHQQRTVDRYDRLVKATDFPIMPVLQGFKPSEYLQHIDDYGDRLKPKMRVGVGSICKRNGHPAMIQHILELISAKRPDLRLHGFGIKFTALCRSPIRRLLYSADSMAWSFAARKEGRNGNSPDEAAAYIEKINQLEDWVF